MNNLTVFIAAWSEYVWIFEMRIAVTGIIIFRNLLQVFARWIPSHTLVLGGASFRSVFTAFFVTVVAAVGAANTCSRTPNEPITKITAGRCGIIVLLETVGCGESHVSICHGMTWNKKEA